jgi:succinyl-CoA synthetase alpha subunit
MSILVDEKTGVLIQGITGKQGRFHTLRMLESGTRVCAGTSPGKGGQSVNGVPVFNKVAEAVQEHPEINTSVILVPPQFVLASGMEAVEAGIPLIIIVTEFTPVLDTLKIVDAAREKGLRVIGPNTIGVISPGKSKAGVMPSFIYKPGHIGIISRSGTLTHEMASDLSFRGFGQSTCVGIGGDPIIGSSHMDILKLFEKDSDTDLLILIGEIGGGSEEEAAEYIRSTKFPKPVAAVIAGANAPKGKKMGHAGAIVSGGKGTASSKIEALKEAGVYVGETMDQVIDFVREWNESNHGRLQTVEPIFG